MEQTRQLFSLEAEQSVIGGVLLQPAVMVELVLQGVAAELFFSVAHQVIWRVFQDMHDQSKPVDMLTVAAALEANGDGDEIGGLGYLAEVAKNTPGVSNISSYAQLVLDYAVEREWVALSLKLRDVFMSRSDAGHEGRITQAQQLVTALSSERRPASMVAVKDALKLYLDDLEKRYDNPGIRGLLTAYHHVDYRLQGMQPGDLIIVAGRPGMGKTTYAMNVAANVARAGKRAIVFSMEMTTQKLVQRMLAAEGNVKLGLLKSAKVLDDDASCAKLTHGVGRIMNFDMQVDDQAGLTIHDIRARVQREHRRKAVDLVVVDYLGLVESGNQRDNVSFRVAEISRGLKMLAKEICGVAMVLSQVNRECEKRANKRPGLSDLRDSGAIEQDADVVQFLYRDEIYNEDSPAKGQVEVNSAKLRDGEPGTDYLIWKGEYNRIEDNPRPNAPPVGAYDDAGAFE